MKAPQGLAGVVETLPGLYAWYRRTRRRLPFRSTRSPYHIWVSEIMLQQTRVAAMLPRYASFLQRFPSVDSLARATEDEVVAAWQGLGYYSRARNLRRAAQKIVLDHRGRFPRSESAARALPGIGAYTSAAVLSIAYGIPLAVVDGNVRRVLARLLGEMPSDTEALAAGLLAERGRARPGTHNQALMELGATICTPRSPSCTLCPLMSVCIGHMRFGSAVAARLPVRKKRVPPIEVAMRVIVPRSGGRLLIVRDTQSHLLRNLWFFPFRLSVQASGDLLYATPGVEHWFVETAQSEATGTVHFRHSITRHRIAGRAQLRPLTANAGSALQERTATTRGRLTDAQVAPVEWRFVPADRVGEYVPSSILGKLSALFEPGRKSRIRS